MSIKEGKKDTNSRSGSPNHVVLAPPFLASFVLMAIPRLETNIWDNRVTAEDFAYLAKQRGLHLSDHDSSTPPAPSCAHCQDTSACPLVLGSAQPPHSGTAEQKAETGRLQVCYLLNLAPSSRSPQPPELCSPRPQQLGQLSTARALNLVGGSPWKRDVMQITTCVLAGGAKSLSRTGRPSTFPSWDPRAPFSDTL